MLRDVIERELKDCIYGYRSILVFVLSAVLFLMAIYTGAREYQAQLQEYRLSQAALRQQITEQTTLYAFSTAGLNFVKPPPVLGILVNGVEPYTPQVYWLNLYALPEPRGGPTSENPSVAAFGALDLPFIVEVVLGLAAFLFTLGTICGEKETGTLKLQLANPVPKDVLLVGKLVGNLVGLLVPVALSFLLACLMLATLPSVSLSGKEVVRIFLLGVNFFLYLAVLFALGLWISTLTTRTTTAFALCLVVWVLLVAIVPKLAVVAGKRISPLESLQEFQMKKAEIDRQGTVEFEEVLNKYSREHNGPRVPPEVREKLLARVRDDQSQASARIEEDYVQRKQRQAQTALVLSRLSPAGSASHAAMCLAWTGLERDFRFRAALRNYRSGFTSYYDRKSRELLAMTSDAQTSPVTVKYRFTDLPPFEFHEERLAVSLSSALPDMGFLVVWALVFFVAAYFRFLRYDVR